MLNGYENSTVSLILKELKISKGAFYHYFTSKEACADAAVQRFAKESFEKVQQKIDIGVSASINFKNLIFACSTLFKENESNLKEINVPSNAIFHQKLMVALIKEMASLFSKVISQGVKEKVFETEYPLETAEMILTLSNFYFDADLFGWKSQDIPLKMLAFEGLLTQTLNAKPGFFSFLHQ